MTSTSEDGTPLTPLEFMRRARRLYAGRDAVVSGGVRRTYAQFFERCARWSTALQALSVGRGLPRPTESDGRSPACGISAALTGAHPGSITRA